MSRPYKVAEFDIIFGEGVNKLVSVATKKHFLTFSVCHYFDSSFGMQGCILDCAEMMDIVLKKGSWYSYGDHRYGFHFWMLWLLIWLSLLLFCCVLHPPNDKAILCSFTIYLGKQIINDERSISVKWNFSILWVNRKRDSYMV